MRVVTFTVPPAYDDKKLCAFLRGEAQISYALYATLRHIPDAVTRGGSPVRSIDRVHAGDRIRVSFPDEQTKLTPTEMELRILYEDEDILALDKPGNIAMHPSHGHQTDTLANGVTAYLQRSGSGGVFHAVGRLDKGTSGVALCAKHAYAASRMNGQTEKTYLALVDRELSGGGTVDVPIYRPDPGKTTRACGSDGERAVTHYEVLCAGGGKSLVRLRPETGRTHQIRVHMAHIGAPLTGDALYGAADPALGRHLLHCETVRVRHPVDDKVMTFTAPLPPEFVHMLHRSIPDAQYTDLCPIH
jgi:23S rRNA pseudouridine1911/1915/1917 synthase